MKVSLDSLQKEMERSLPSPKWDNCVVEFVFDSGSREIVSSYFKAFSRVANVKKWNMPISEDDLTKYFLTLLHIRVLIVNKERLDGYSSMKYDLAIPSIFYLFLENIGVAKDRFLGKKFIPYLKIEEASKEGKVSVRDITKSDLMTPEELVDFSDNLSTFEDAGFEFGYDLPKKTIGSLEMMTMFEEDGNFHSLIQGVHPVYANLLAFVRTADSAGVVKAYHWMGDRKTFIMDWRSLTKEDN